MKYFIQYNGPKGKLLNQYFLVYTNSTRDEEQAQYEGYRRISRKEAEKLASAERRRRRENPNYAGYASAYIYPFFPYGVKNDFENYPWLAIGNIVYYVGEISVDYRRNNK